ncbi:hypothetical protein LTR84_002744 [Exophiala bonariae]|uniref:Uncharacterized protein n=1 Tax=Exophiala bonariae TaxID=1690606 RepID=A0AAV9N8W9_9EURO|nr:hypothetical protein LTR84_002744 [Exophiala bonariae]
MHFTKPIKGLVLALAIAPLSSAVPQGFQQDGNYNGIGRGYPAPITNCYTDAVTKQTRRPSTKWSTRTTSCTWTSTTALTVTTTPVTTSTVTKTDTKTSTAPPTNTTTTTTTTTSTSTSTSTTTTTTTISTFTVVPTSTGFIPIETSVPGSTTQRTPTKSKKRAPRFNPDVEFARGYSPANLNSSRSGAKLLPAGDVNCYVNVGKCATATVKLLQQARPRPPPPPPVLRRRPRHRLLRQVMQPGE